MNLPNKLTIARCVLAAIFVALMSIGHIATYIIAYIVFIAACITDYYDGKIARAQGLVTNFGKLVDPVADKVLMTSAFLMLMGHELLRIPAWTIILILAREFTVTGARSLAASEGNVIQANIWGKRKTVFQMIYVFTFMFFAMLFHVVETYPAVGDWAPEFWASAETWIGWASLAGIIFVSYYTVYSGIQFVRVNWEQLGIHDLS